MTVLDLPERWDELDDPTRLRLNLEGARDRGRRRPADRRSGSTGSPSAPLGDQMDLASAEAFARRLAPLHTVEGPVREDSLSRAPELPDLLGLADVRSFDLDAAWQPRPQRDRLRVPVGIGDNGGPVLLDIKESAQQGMGPHGLVIGATGSGKSEFLRTLVLGLAMTHSTETLNMVLVDFKGGATFAGLSEMPHVSAVITNLENELTLVDRMQDALSGEMVRRQELLRGPGNYASLSDYEKARASGEADLDPLPSLFIVVDEFSEMLSAKPEFIDLFVAIGRLGRSLGMHLLLASQRLEEGRLRGLESHLSYRIGLRTFSALGVPRRPRRPRRLRAAARSPGLGYLKPDQSTLLRFKAAYVSGPPPRVGRGSVSRSSRRAPDRPALHARPRARPARGRARGPGRRGHAARLAARRPTTAPCSTSPSTGWTATAPRPTRCGCRRSTCPTPSTRSWPTSPRTPSSAWSRRRGAPAAASSSRSAPSTGRASSAATP